MRPYKQCISDTFKNGYADISFKVLPSTLTVGG